MPSDLPRGFARGSRISAREAEQIEQRLLAHPEDVRAHKVLLGYYALQRFRDPRAQTGFWEHGEWLIVHRAAEPRLGSHTLVRRGAEPGLYARFDGLWEAALVREPDRLEVVDNASVFFGLDDGERALELLEWATRADPDQGRWWLQLGVLSLRQAGEFLRPTDPDGVRRAFEALRSAKDCRYVPELLSKHLARAAYACGERDVARREAESLASSKSLTISGEVQSGHVLLGLLAVDEGRLEQAEQHLFRAIDRVAPGVMTSFGPNMSLCLRLLEEERRGACLEFLRRCRSFWRKPILEEWIRTVEGGAIPDFKANLIYF